MNIYTGLLFNQGYVSDPELARSLAQTPRETLADAGPPDTPDDPDAPRPGRPPARRHRRWTGLQASVLWPLR